jgi:hypothetical protein
MDLLRHFILLKTPTLLLLNDIKQIENLSNMMLFSFEDKWFSGTTNPVLGYKCKCNKTIS